MISSIISGIVVLAAFALLVNVPGVSPTAHALAHDCLRLVSALLTFAQNAINGTAGKANP